MHLLKIDEPARTYERTPGTNSFTSGTHTAVLLGKRKMKVDGRIYYWGPWRWVMDPGGLDDIDWDWGGGGGCSSSG